MSSWLDWANLLTRWIHFGAGIAWIGSSLYFVWLDRSLERGDRPGVEGSLWMVHSGGFYQVEKRLLGPGEMPTVLHWFKWEAALTWASGIVLLTVVYYLTGGMYLVDPTVSAVTPVQATLLAALLLAVSWFLYDALWLSPLGRAGWPAVVFSFVYLAGAMYLLTHLLSGRAAFIHVGAIMGTIMVANVWLRILPAQQQMIDATRQGKAPDLELGKAAKKRSMHNSYMTFPVLFIMLSNHFPATYSGEYAWITLALLIVAGAAARQAMIGGSRALAAAVASACLLGAALTSGADGTAQMRRRGHDGATAGDATFAQARAVINARCLPCHSRAASDDVFTAAPNGVVFDLPEEIVRYAERIRERAVVQQTMPMANKTGMTDEERAVLDRWISGGAALP